MLDMGGFPRQSTYKVLQALCDITLSGEHARWTLKPVN